MQSKPFYWCVPDMTLHLPRVADGSQKRPILRAIVGASAAAPRKLNCKLVLVTHHYVLAALSHQPAF